MRDRLSWFLLALLIATVVFCLRAQAFESDHDRIVRLESTVASNQYVAGVTKQLSDQLIGLRADLSMSQKTSEDRYAALEKIGWAIVLGLAGNLVALIWKATWGKS